MIRSLAASLWHLRIAVVSFALSSFTFAFIDTLYFSGAWPRDTRKLILTPMSLLRYNATKLEAQLRTAVARNQGSVETRAHLVESLGMLTEALRAKMQRG